MKWVLFFISALSAEAFGCLGHLAADNLIQFLHATEHSFYPCSEASSLWELRGLLKIYMNHPCCRHPEEYHVWGVQAYVSVTRKDSWGDLAAVWLGNQWQQLFSRIHQLLMYLCFLIKTCLLTIITTIFWNPFNALLRSGHCRSVLGGDKDAKQAARDQGYDKYYRG